MLWVSVAAVTLFVDLIVFVVGCVFAIVGF